MELVQPLEWTRNDYVFVPQLDADHQQLFHDMEMLRRAVTEQTPTGETAFYTWRLSRTLSVHLAAEERKMRRSRYPACGWHERQHQAGRKKMTRLMEAIRTTSKGGTAEALQELAQWLRDHIGLADRMFAAHLRNEVRERLVS